MPTQGFKRKLTAILSADVKGYSRLMGEDEEATIRTLTAYRDLMSTHIQKHQGRVVDSPGDNLLAEFPSVVDAVRSAVEIQEELSTRNAQLPDNRRMWFRIGINLGDVVEEADRIYGDGVNIAARMESLADGGGICISGTVYDQVKNKIALGYEYMGEQPVKNIKEPIRAYRVGFEAEAALPELRGVLELPEKPSIAVLPFVNMSQDPEQEYFSDGMTEDLITDLSKISGLFVIARNSVFTYKGRPVNVQKVGSELGVRYVLEGSVRRAEHRVRINAQLVDAITGGHIWADRYDRNLQDIFALQDEVTKKIVSALEVKLTEAERGGQFCKCRYTCNIEAYDHYLRGMEYVNRFTKQDNEKAREFFEKAIALDKQYALAYATLGYTYFNEWSLGWSEDPHMLERALEQAQRSIALDDSVQEAHCLMGDVYIWRGQHEQAIAEMRKAIDHDPNHPEGFVGLGSALSWAGRADEGIDYIKKAMRLDPNDQVIYLWSLGHAYFLNKQYDEGIAAFRRVLRLNPDFHPAHFFLVATYSELGRDEEARAHLKDLLLLWPEGSLEAARQRLPYKDPAVLERLLDNVARTGLT